LWKKSGFGFLSLKGGGVFFFKLLPTFSETALEGTCVAGNDAFTAAPDFINDINRPLLEAVVGVDASRSKA
jgi:hypothetical protein